MKLFIVTDHDTHWPVGGASVIVAENASEATLLLDEELRKCGLKTSTKAPYTLQELSLTIPSATILNDGDY